MPQYFVTSSVVNNKYRIEGDDFRHLSRVRRVRRGDLVALRTETGARLQARIVRITDSWIEAEVVGRGAHAPSPPEVTLCMGILKGKSFDTVVEKSVELGVARILPIMCERSVPRITDDRERMKRWKRKAIEASKQCMRDSVPEVARLHSFEEAIAAVDDGIRIIAHPGSDASLRQALDPAAAGPAKAALLVGPEGGFSEREIERASASGWIPVNFGFTQLRAGTAAIVLCGIIIYEFEQINLPPRD
jgi:16S rRNA (uracil1498-N3)-methyltransferase